MLLALIFLVLGFLTSTIAASSSNLLSTAISASLDAVPTDVCFHDSTSGKTVISKRSGNKTPTLAPRVNRLTPLLRPGKGETPAEFVYEAFLDADTDEIPIVPSDEQVLGWKVTENKISVGANGYWYPFEKDSKVWEMSGLTGCTGVFVITPYGFWAGHFWEGGPKDTDADHGYGSFLEYTGNRPNPWKERSPDVFKQIAADILSVPAPPSARGSFMSLADVKESYRPQGIDPFGCLVDVYVFTRAASGQLSGDSNRFNPKYPDLIKTLTDAIKNFIPNSNDPIIRAYVGQRSDSVTNPQPDSVAGLNILNYSPWATTAPDGRSPMAAVNIWAEGRPRPAYTSPAWKPLDSQKG